MPLTLLYINFFLIARRLIDLFLCHAIYWYMYIYSFYCQHSNLFEFRITWLYLDNEVLVPGYQPSASGCAGRGEGCLQTGPSRCHMFCRMQAATVLHIGYTCLWQPGWWLMIVKTYPSEPQWVGEDSELQLSGQHMSCKTPSAAAVWKQSLHNQLSNVRHHSNSPNM